MSYIKAVKATEILDSRGNPTVEVMIMAGDVMAKASVPSGASTGEHEALELRDGDAKRYFGKGVQQAVAHVNGPIAQILVGEHVFDQARLDRLMVQNDGSANKGRYGANAILGASLALARAGALTAKLPLFRYIGGCHTFILPCPMMNIINGGAHADNSLDFQEFMIRPVGAPTLREAVRWGSEIFHTLKKLLKEEGHVTAVGDEGGFAPNLGSNEETCDIIIAAIEKAGYHPGTRSRWRWTAPHRNFLIKPPVNTPRRKRSSAKRSMPNAVRKNRSPTWKNYALSILSIRSRMD